MHILGELQYLANATQLDIAYVVNRLAAYTANPTSANYVFLQKPW
jgi:hypothetical protein